MMSIAVWRQALWVLLCGLLSHLLCSVSTVFAIDMTDDYSVHMLNWNDDVLTDVVITPKTQWLLLSNQGINVPIPRLQRYFIAVQQQDGQYLSHAVDNFRTLSILSDSAEDAEVPASDRHFADFNADGYLDVWIQISVSKSIVVYGDDENNTKPAVIDFDGFIAAAGMTQQANDYNGDGYLDIVALKASKMHAVAYGSAHGFTLHAVEVGESPTNREDDYKDMSIISDNSGSPHRIQLYYPDDHALTIDFSEALSGVGAVEWQILDVDGDQQGDVVALKEGVIVATAFIKNGTVAIESYVYPTNNAQTLPGTINGEFQVSQLGAAEYSIPIEIPPGKDGLQPSISVNYSSQAGNGLLGVGWNLNAGGSIVRCGTTIAQDGIADGVDLDESDQYCLNGQRLRMRDSNSRFLERDRPVYTEMESFSDIYARGNHSFKFPARFHVYTRDGIQNNYNEIRGYYSAYHLGSINRVKSIGSDSIDFVFCWMYKT